MKFVSNKKFEVENQFSVSISMLVGLVARGAAINDPSAGACSAAPSPT